MSIISSNEFRCFYIVEVPLSFCASVNEHDQSKLVQHCSLRRAFPDVAGLLFAKRCMPRSYALEYPRFPRYSGNPVLDTLFKTLCLIEH